jgi:hypothetical protein
MLEYFQFPVLEESNMPNLTALHSVLANQSSRCVASPSCETGPMRELILRHDVQVHPTTEVNPAVVDHVNLRPFVRRLAYRMSNP